mgnify:CR=1 FL=1
MLQVEAVKFYNADVTKAAIDWTDVDIIYLTDLSWDSVVRKSTTVMKLALTSAVKFKRASSILA